VIWLVSYRVVEPVFYVHLPYVSAFH
jgi:hypothetical protein